MTAKYYIASKPLYNLEIPLIERYIQHLYLIKDGDGNLSTLNDQYVIRGGPDIEAGLSLGNIELEINTLVGSSQDSYSGSNLVDDREVTEISITDTDWTNMVTYTQGLGTISGTGRFDTNFEYDPIGSNSNSVISSALNSAGYNLIDLMPYEDGDTNNSQLDFNKFSGANYLLGTTGNDTFTVDDSIRFIDGGAGDDTFIVNDLNAFKNLAITDTQGTNSVEFGTISSTDTIQTLKSDGNYYVQYTDGSGNDRFVSFLDVLDGSGNLKSGVSINIEYSDSNTSSLSDIVSNNTATSITNPDRNNTVDSLSSLIDGFIGLFGTTQGYASPLVLDLDGDGIELTSLSSNPVYWDIDQDGFAEASGWVKADDGLLAIDLNSDGLINDNGELFGTETTDGFTVLSAYDTNSDNKIDANDTQFSDLRVWQDINQDGISQSGELSTLSALNIESINLNASGSDYYLQGNHITHESSFTFTNQTTNDIVDVWFNYDNTNTRYNLDYDLDVRTLFLPTLRGYGEMADLHIAMSNDETLLDMVKDLADKSFLDLFDDTTSFKQDVVDIMYRWAGIENDSLTSRGNYVDDARKINFQEQYLGEAYYQGTTYELRPLAARDMLVNFENMVSEISEKLLLQMASQELFTGTVSYDLEDDTITGITGLDTTAVDDLETKAGLETSPEDFWKSVLFPFIDFINSSTLTTTELNYLDDAIQNTTTSDTLASITDAVADGFSDSSTFAPINYGASDDTINGTFLNDDIDAGAGNDTIYGSDGLDIIDGEDGNDIIHGDLGGDTLNGGAGDDTYFYDLGDGFDAVFDSSGSADTLSFGSSMVTGNFTFERHVDDLLVKYNGDDVVFVQDHFDNQITKIESFDFAYDTTSVDYEDISITTYGSIFDDVILFGQDYQMGGMTSYGYAGNDQIQGSIGNDTIYGGTGDDNVSGRDGNDIVHGDAGNDQVNGNDGDDTLYGGDGDDIVRGYDDADTLYGGNGNDTLYAQSEVSHSSTSAEELRGGAGDDTIYGADGIDTIYGDADNDTIYGYAGNDVIYGGDGNDIIDTGGGGDTVFAGAGNDTISDSGIYTVGDVISFDGGAGDDIYNIGNSILPSGSTYYVSVNDASGDDVLNIADPLSGSESTFSMEQVGDDLVIYVDRHVITVADQFAQVGLYAIDEINITHNGDTEVTTYDMTTWTSPSGETFNGTSSGENHNGTSYADILYGNGGNDTLGGLNGDDLIYGGDGNDTLRGWNQNDTIYGDDGSDTIYGGYGNDTLYGGLGNDTIHSDYGEDTIIINYGEGDDNLYASTFANNSTRVKLVGIDQDNIRYKYLGNNYVDLIYDDTSSSIRLNLIKSGTDYSIEYDDSTVFDFSSEVTITDGTNGDNTINGTSSVDLIYTKSGHDTVYAGAGDDGIRADGSGSFYGEAGNDYITLFGSIGSYFNGGSGSDFIEGGSGADTFEHVLADNVGEMDQYDGNQGADILQLKTVTAELSNTVRDEILSARKHMDDYYNVSATAGTQATFNSLGFNINATFSDLELYVDGVLTSTDAVAANDDFIVAQDEYAVGNLLLDNGNGADSTFGSQADVTAVTGVSTTQGGTITITADGTFTYTAPTSFTGTDTYTYTLDDGYGGTDTATISFDLSQTVTSGTSSAETVNGTNGANVLSGLGGNDTINGYNGNDVIYGGDGNDFIRAGNDNDIIYGGDGNDSLYGDTGDDFIFGEAGNDTYVAKGGDTYFDGGAGFNTANYTILGFSGGITANLETGVVTKADGSTDTLVNVERLLATSSNDNITGGDLGETIEGRQGNDTIYGGGGNDFLYGNEGDDYIDGQGGLDTIKGGDGNDTIHGGIDNDSLWGEAGNDTLHGYDGNDTLVGSLGNDTFYGGSGINIANYSTLGGSVTVDMDATSNQVTKYDSSYDDLTDVQIVYGTNYNDTLSGGHNINLQGRGGNDTITGGVGADYLYGNDGNDILHGAGFNDRLYGGAGDDTFIFNRSGGADSIVNDDSVSTGDLVDFGTSGTAIDRDQLWFEQSGNHLLVTVIGTDDTLKLENWYTTGYTVDTFESTDGYSLTASDVSTLVDAMALETKPSLGQTTMPTATYNNLATDITTVWT